MISSATTRKVIEATDIVEVVGEYVSLKKKGTSYFGLCPFHDDKNPSMSVSGEKKIFNCFSCNTKGNVIYFVSKYENISMEQATIKLAKRAGIKIEDAISTQNEKTTRLLRVMEEAYNFYRFYLYNSDEGKVALAYLKARGIDDDIIKKHKIGLAPKNLDYLHQALNRKQITTLDQIELGLVKDVNGKVHDIFRNRIMFSITNASGQIVGFSGRIYEKSDQAKYINSTENALFHKGEILYNYDQAAREARKKNQIFLFEGFMDVIACEKAGLNNAVASMGTAMTSEHVKMLTQITKNIVLFFDGDEAGIKAMKRSAQMLARNRIIPNAVLLPDDLDPDEYIAKYGTDKFNGYVLGNMKNVYLILYELAYKNVYLEDFMSVETFKKQVFDFIKLANSDVITSYFINRLSEDLKIDVDLIKSDLNAYKPYNDTYDYNQVYMNEPVKKVETINVQKKKNVKVTSSVIMAYQTVIKQAVFSKEALSVFFETLTTTDGLRFPGSELAGEFDLLYVLSNYYNENPTKEGIGIDLLYEMLNDKPSSLKLAKKIMDNKFILADSEQMLNDSIMAINKYFKKQDNIASYNATILSKNEEERKKNMHEFIEISKSQKKIIKEDM